MDLDIVWTQGTCNGDAYFITNKEICFKSGSFIKFCSTQNFSEISIQGPLTNIECICTDSDLNIMAVASNNMYILNYPKLEIINEWVTEMKSCIIQMCFAEDCYLLTLEGSPSFNLTLWNWKTKTKIKNVCHKCPINDASACFISVHPFFKSKFVFQQLNRLHIYEIEDVSHTIDFRKKTIYLPIVGDKIGTSGLDDEGIENLTFFDKMKHGTWGIHSELLHSITLKSLCSQLSQDELVSFYDFLTKQDRLQASSHCWLPDKRLLVSCFNGTILSISLNSSVELIYFPTNSQDKLILNNYITCMALNKNGLYLAKKDGQVFIVQNLEKWELTLLISTKECPKHLRFSPDFQNLLIVNRNGTICCLDVTEDETDSMYLSTCQDDSSIIGIFATKTSSCITAKVSGLIEIWDINTGVPLSQFHINEKIKCIEGCPSSSTILVSGYSSYIFVVDYSNIKDLRIVQISRPCEKVIKFIACENFGRLAFFISEDNYIFIYSILPSAGFNMQGYIEMNCTIPSIAVFSKGAEDIMHLSAVGQGESEDVIICMKVPNDFIVNFNEYWIDGSGKIKSDALEMTFIKLRTKCCSIVAHLLNGFILYLPIYDEFINIPYENIKTFDFKIEEKQRVIDCKQNRMFLSPSHYMILTINNTNDIFIRKSHNFNLIYKQKFSKSLRLSLCCAFTKNLLLVEGSTGILTCLKLSGIQDMDEMSWESYCKSKAIMEDRFLIKMETVCKGEIIPWTVQQLKLFYEEPIKKLKETRNILEEKFKKIEVELKNLIEENFSVPVKHRLEAEEFILDNEVKEQIIKSRSDEIESCKITMKEKLDKIETNICDIKRNCIDSMLVRGKILKPLRQGTSVYNYSVPALSEKEKEEISYSFKKGELEKYLAKLKLNKGVKVEDIHKQITFEKYSEAEDIPGNIGKVINTPFELQSREDRIDYIFLLKYIIFKKRLAFNIKFDTVESLKKDTNEKIKEHNNHIKKLMLSINETSVIWEPSTIDSDSILDVIDEEIETAIKVHSEKHDDKPYGIADEFFKDEWFLKLKATSDQKSKSKFKKDNIDFIKLDIEKKLKSVDSLAEYYDRNHAELAKGKLQSDLEINQDELQLYLILFSAANSSAYKSWELDNRNAIGEFRCRLKAYTTEIRELETHISKCSKEIESLVEDIESLDKEVLNKAKISRNKQGCLEAYETRPVPFVHTESLNPYKETYIAISCNTFEELNSGKNKPDKVSWSAWKELCCSREQKYKLESEIQEKTLKVAKIQDYMEKLSNLRSSLRNSIKMRKESLKKIHELRTRCNYETPMILPVKDQQLEFKYPDCLDFNEALFFRKFHIVSLNGMITNAGNHKLHAVQNIAKTEYKIARNESKYRIDKLKLRDTLNEIELVRNLPLTKDVQRIIQDPKGFSIQVKIDAFDKSKQMEMNEITKQNKQISERIGSIEMKRDILKKSTIEKKNEIEKLKGDIAELRKIEKLAMKKSD